MVLVKYFTSFLFTVIFISEWAWPPICVTGKDISRLTSNTRPSVFESRLPNYLNIHRQKRHVDLSDIRGPFCASRTDEQCCPGRDDRCTVPILGSFCYCDLFCNITALDCCPDFVSFCVDGSPVGNLREYI